MMNSAEKCDKANIPTKACHPILRKIEHLSPFKHTVRIYIFFLIFFLTSWGKVPTGRVELFIWGKRSLNKKPGV